MERIQISVGIRIVTEFALNLRTCNNRCIKTKTKIGTKLCPELILLKKSTYLKENLLNNNKNIAKEKGFKKQI